MDFLIVYLNELSCRCEGLSLDEIRRLVICAIDVVRAAHCLRNEKEMALQLHKPLNKITLGQDQFTLTHVLARNQDLFRKLKSILDKSPMDSTYQQTQQVYYKNDGAVGMSWADHFGSFVVSIGHLPDWLNHTIDATRISLNEHAEATTVEVKIRNLAAMQHVKTDWCHEIKAYGYDPAKSSILYHGPGDRFVIRMHRHDHEPPHVHVYPQANHTYDCLAKVQIDKPGILRGKLQKSIRDEVFAFIDSNRDDLLREWKRCQRG